MKNENWVCALLLVRHQAGGHTFPSPRFHVCKRQALCNSYDAQPLGSDSPEFAFLLCVLQAL